MHTPPPTKKLVFHRFKQQIIYIGFFRFPSMYKIFDSTETAVQQLRKCCFVQQRVSWEPLINTFLSKHTLSFC